MIVCGIRQAGEVMLVGQITDGIGTICIGQLVLLDVSIVK